MLSVFLKFPKVDFLLVLYRGSAYGAPSGRRGTLITGSILPEHGKGHVETLPLRRPPQQPGSVAGAPGAGERVSLRPLSPA